MTSVLYQRGIYPPEDFKVVKKYGLNVLITTDEEVKNYIKRIMGQLSRMNQFVVTNAANTSFRLDERWKNLEAGHGYYFERHRRSTRKMAIRCSRFRKALIYCSIR